MKCPHCNGEHPDNYRFCPITGEEIMPQFKACTNEGCPDYGKYILPLEAKFCPRCGKPIRVGGKGSTQKKGQDANHSQTADKNHFASHGSSHSQIVVVCSKAGSFIQIGHWQDDEDEGLQREKRIRLRKGENVINVEEYPELQYGFSFDEQSDKPEHIEEIILDGYDTSNVTNMSCMFWGCDSLESLDLSCFDTSNVTDMSSMFEGCSSLESLDLSGFDTSNVTNMGCMFEGCSSLESLDLSGFDTFNVTYMGWMFWGCSSLESLDLSGFDTLNVTDMSNMFSSCSSLESLNLSDFDTSNVTDMTAMFDGCSSLDSLDLSGFDTENVTSMSCMFYGCSSLETLDLSGFDTSNVTNMRNMFHGCDSLEFLDLDGFDISNASTDGMFDGCSEEIQEQYECLL